MTDLYSFAQSLICMGIILMVVVTAIAALLFLGEAVKDGRG